MGKNQLIVIAIIIHWPTPSNPGQVSSPLTFQATSTMELLKPYKGFMHFFLAYKTTSHIKPCAWYHVQDQNHLTHSRVKINPYNPPFKFDLGISHTPPYHLGLSLDFTIELPGYACLTRSYSHMPFYMQTISAPLIFFMCLMVTTPSPPIASSSHFSMLVFFLIAYHASLCTFIQSCH